QGKKSQGTGLHADVAQAPQWPLLPVVAVLRTLQQSLVEVRVVAKAGGCALLTALVFVPGIASALPVADPAGGANRPNVVQAPNGVPVIEIVNPNAAGLSHNKFQSFDTVSPGVVFNNSLVNGTSRLGGAGFKNPNLVQQANGILVDVTGSAPSSLNGTLEVFGKKADLFISNANGVTLNGVDTLNVNSLTVTTGKPIVGASGLQFSVNDGRVTVGPSGVDTSNLSYFDIVARAIALEGPVGSATNTTDIAAIAGLNTYTAGTRQVDVNSASAAGTPAVAIDGTFAGAMHGRNISLRGTETGAGVRHAGRIQGAQDILISAQGDISVASVQAGRNASLSTPGALQVGTGAAGQGLTAVKAVTLNAGKTITISNAVQGDTLSVTANRLLVQAAQLSATSSAPGPVKSINIKVGDFTLSGTLVASNLDGSPVAADQPLVIADGKLQVQRGVGNFDENFTLKTDAMVISHNGVNIEADTIANNGGIVQDLGSSGINLLARQLTNKGIINTQGDMKLVTDVLNNLCTGMGQQICAGLMAGGKADLQAGALTNEAGLVAGTDLDLTLKGQSQNTDRAAITAKGQLTIKQAAGNQAALVSSGKIISGGDLLVILDALSTANKDALVHADGKATFQISTSFSNGGTTQAAQDLNIAAGDFTNGAEANLLTDQNLQVVAKHNIDLARGGNVYAGQVGTLSAAELHNAGTVIAREKLDLQAEGQFLNDTGTWLASRVLNITGAQLTNIGARFDVDDQLNITVNGDISNAGQSLLLSGGDISLVAGGAFYNLDGSVVAPAQHLRIDADKVVNAGKALDNEQVSTLAGSDITLKARRDVRNEANGTIAATHTLQVQSDTGSIENATGANLQGDTVSLTSGQNIKNRDGAIIQGDQQVTVLAQNDVSNSGQSYILSTGDLNLTAGGQASNLDGSLVSATQNLHIDADKIANSGKSVSAGSTLTGDAVTLKARSDVRNEAQANILAKGTLDVQAGASVANVDANLTGTEVTLKSGTDVLNQHGAIAGDSIHIDSLGDLFNTAKSTLIAKTDAVINAAKQLLNDDALIKGSTVKAVTGSIDNASGANILGDTVNLSATQNITNRDAAIIKADNQVSMQAQGDVVNMGNAIIATPKLTIGANNVSNVQSGKILGDDIAIQAKNEVVSGTSASIKSNQIAIDADHFHGSNSEILATDNIDIKTSEYANTANISSQNTATLSIKNGGDFYSDQTQRAPQAEQLLTINAHDVTTNIELNNPGSIHINASGDVHNNQGIVTGKSLVVKAAGAIENAAEQIVFAAQDLILEAGTAISNLQDAQILGLGNVSLTASEVTNDRGRITSGADMSIDADTLTNRGAATGTAAVAGHSFVVGNYDWPHDGRSTSIIVGMNLPYYKSEISVTQAVIESSGDLNINQGAKHGRGGHITNADSLLTAAGNIKVDGNLSNTSTEASKSLYQLLNGTGEVTIGAQDSLAPLNPTKKIYASLWDLLSNTYGSDNNDHTIFAAYKYYDEDMSKTLQNTYNPVFNQLMSATFGADWRGLSRDELSNRFKNLQPSASLAFSGDKQAEISAGGTFTHTGGAFTNGGQQKVQQTVQVKVGDETISTLQGNFDRTFNSGVLFDFSKTPSLAELTAALNPQNVLERLMQTRALFDIHSAPPPLMLDVSKIGNRLSTSALGAEVARVNTSIVTTPVAASAPQAFTPIYPVYETRIPYITLKTFYGSQYFFDKIDYHSDRTVPVIGDAFFDNQLITQSIQETVGGYFAAKDGLSGAELVKTLMDNAALEAVAQGLHFGEPLTQAQYKNLTHNIIWYEPKVVNGYTVLSPRVYLSRATLEDVANNKATTAVVASRGQLSIDASKVSNVDAAIHGGSVYIHSADSIHNQNTGGGT
ncbi:filamentous hemagglutinin N-terminal domain-containing protein, partial [Pseudomonas koreensis]|uniref:two-partner secretion domain-containing protein n=1 Tax=Pseudomonas koreensis TaxID=198620 RepID=UPI001B33DCA8